MTRISLRFLEALFQNKHRSPEPVPTSQQRAQGAEQFPEPAEPQNLRQKPSGIFMAAQELLVHLPPVRNPRQLKANLEFYK